MPAMFNGERLKQAREILGMTQQDLALAAQRDQSYISLIEQNARQPSDSVIETLTLVTRFPATFFALPSGPDFPLGSLLFRKKSDLPAVDNALIRQTARLVLEVFQGLYRRFKQMEPALPRFGDTSAATAAQLTRSALGYPPDGPIRGLLNRIEKSGVLVFRLPVNVNGFDAFSAWSSEDTMRPVIALGPPKAGERERATLAHELGHLVLHYVFLGDLSAVEAQAGQFGGEFLFPEADARQEASGTLTLTRLAELKQRWGLSMQYILKRLEDLEIISPQQKSYWRGKMYRQGWLGEGNEDREPVRLPADTPGLLRQMIEKAYGAPPDVKRIAKDFGMPARILADVLAANGREPFRTSFESQGRVLEAPRPAKLPTTTTPLPTEQKKEPESVAEKPRKSGSVLNFRR